MVKVKKDITGEIFGRLKVLGQTEDYITPGGRHMDQWLCECSCEEKNKIVVIGNNLRKNNGTRSCGCLRKEFCSNHFKRYNQYDLSGEYGIGWTNNTNQEFYFDLEDYDKIKDYCWYELSADDGYRSLTAYITEIKKYKHMSQIIVGDYYDHKNRNTLDNRRVNLRPADKFQNAQNHNKQRNNTSGITGVGWHKDANKWYARIRTNDKETWLGLYDNKQDAIVMRLLAEQQGRGEFAPQEHLFEQYKINLEEDYSNDLS
jgi:hypothetical protein